jgi:hypothetical protein
MTTDQPPHEATEEAAARLLYLALIGIRFLTAPLVEDQTSQALIQRRDQIHELADLCHNLPGYLAPARRAKLSNGLRYMWEAASPHQQQWIRSCWDQIGYDYRWLADVTREDGPTAEASGG